jgi:serine/threonine protein kinase
LASPKASAKKERKIPSPPGYQMGRVLGQGGMGVVYLGKQISLSRKVAIKVLHPHFTQVVHVKRLLREGRALASLRHNNILSVIDFVQDKGRIYLIMEYIQGVPLSRVIQKLKAVKRPTASAFKKCCKGSQDWGYSDNHYFDLIRKVFIDLAKGMQHAHDHQILHRDIKPSNIMITPSGNPFLLDFGLSTVASEATLTNPQEILGTPLYMAPEQIEGETLTPKTDIYSLGATLYQTLGLKTAHNATSQVALLHSVVNKEPTPINQINPHLPRAFTKIVSKSMAKKPEDRYQSMNEMIQDLEALNFSDGQKEPMPVYNPSAKSGIFSWIFLILGLALMGVGFWWFINQPKKVKNEPLKQEKPTVTAETETQNDVIITDPTFVTFKGFDLNNNIIVENTQHGIFSARPAHITIPPKSREMVQRFFQQSILNKEVLLKPVQNHRGQGNQVEIFYKSKVINTILVSTGLARAHMTPATPMRYKSLERVAQGQERGIWNPNFEDKGFHKEMMRHFKENLR